MNKLLITILSLFFTFPSFTQTKKSPYTTDFIKDGLYITGTVGLNVAGVLLIQNKDDLSQTDLDNLDKDDIWAIDRFAAGNYDKDADELSYIPFYASFATPILFLLGEDERNNFGQISVLFVETMATTGALFTITAGAVEKSRPLVYNTNLDFEERVNGDAQRSFFAGHTAATAAATFFTAKVFQDFNPDSPLVPYVWAGAAAVPAYVGYLRMESGKHFLTDNIIGFGIGAACGILVPELHKVGNENVEINPTASYNIGGTGLNSKGVSLTYKF
ncbi:phosphatase PAP2 family protein [Gramella sp. AN32]|uniref:Phosphatase PAP2 family protein n=1 Tax=Christiangramia antarctica TaxID=2058158 RepID=A0ABW5X1P3_9FLAO|nr:phosphatase PAP2 family protein [Gramella sp. AN32]MCM4157090.1 PA-phosphatase [Gramella sp. AN32]